MVKKNYCEFDVKSVTVQKAAKALENLRTDKPKEAEAILDLLGEIGFDIDFGKDATRIKMPDTLDTWEIRALSKKLIARHDLERLVLEKEEKELEDAFTEDEVSNIIDRASSMDCYSTHRTEAVYRAYKEFKEYQDMIAEENARAYEEEFGDNEECDDEECGSVSIPVIIIGG